MAANPEAIRKSIAFRNHLRSEGENVDRKQDSALSNDHLMNLANPEWFNSQIIKGVAINLKDQQVAIKTHAPTSTAGGSLSGSVSGMTFLVAGTCSDALDKNLGEQLDENWDANNWSRDLVAHLGPFVPIISTKTFGKEIEYLERPQILEVLKTIEDGKLIKFSTKIAERLRFLYQESLHDFPEQIPMSISSLENFIGFFTKNPNIKQPDMVLTPMGNIRIIWRKNRNERVAVEFLSSTVDIRYVVILNNPKYKNRITRMAGLVSPEMLFDILSVYQLDFLFDKDVAANEG